MEREFDVVVIGAGPAGEVVAGRLGEKGASVALVERHLVGGECSFYACMPSKALLRPQEVLAEVARIPGAAEAVTGPLDVRATLARRDEVIHDLKDTGMLPWLAQRGVELVRGEGRLAGERRVEVGDEVLVAERAVVLATGSRAAVPPIPGLADVEPWTNVEATTAKEVPASLLVLGGGVVGSELAQAYRSLGSDVALVEALPRLLAREEPFASDLVADALREAGVDVRTGVKAVAARGEGGGVRLDLDDGASLSAERILVAAGRTPATTGIGLESVGIESGGPIEVDDRLRVPGHEWLYAIGDVNGRALLTHMGKYQGRIAADHILGEDVRIDPASDGALSPRVVFTDPQVAAVGHTEESARAAGIRAGCAEAATSGNAGGSFYGRNAPGQAKLVIDRDRSVVVGATITGADVADFLHAATIAVVGEVPLERLWHAVPSFPTRSELWLRALEGYGL